MHNQKQTKYHNSDNLKLSFAVFLHDNEQILLTIFYLKDFLHLILNYTYM